MGYTKQETINNLLLEFNNIETLYKAKCVNHSGVTSDSKERYSEVLSTQIYRNLSLFNQISPITRKSSYCCNSHDKVSIDLSNSNRDEENFAKRITGLEFIKLGLIRDYQIPLKDSRGNKGLGKIDLISFHKSSNTLYLLELKYIGNKETLLRAVLESYTYYKLVDQVKLVSDITNDNKYKLNKYKFSITPDQIIVKPGVLLVPGCNAYKELIEMNTGELPEMRALTAALAVTFFTLEFLES